MIYKPHFWHKIDLSLYIHEKQAHSPYTALTSYSAQVLPPWHPLQVCSHFSDSISLCVSTIFCVQSAGPSSATLRKPAGYGRLCQDVCIFIIHRRRSKLESPDCWDFLSMHSVLKFAGTSHSILASCPHEEGGSVFVCVINWNVGHIAHTFHSQL